MSNDSARSPSHIQTLLRDGIAAVKARDFARARSLLTQVIDLDERSEQAWLWLSGAVETEADRRICLENVLAINPDSAAAQRGLANLGPALEPGEHVVRRVIAPASPAQAILHPEAQIKEWRWRDPTPDAARLPAIETGVGSSFDDIWNTQKDVCGYCAHEVAPNDRLCPHCQRDLITTQYHYPEPGAGLYYLGVLTLSLAFQFVVQVFLDVSGKATPILIVFDGGLTIALLACAAGVYLRRRRAYLGALVVMPVALFASLIRLAGERPEQNEIMTLLSLLVPSASALTSLLGAAIGFFQTGRDFERIETQLAARLGETLRLEGDLYHTGKTYADRGLWAMAVPYWQRAVANDPRRGFYQFRLGEAYARLGFTARSLDTLAGALRVTIDPALKIEIEQMLKDVRQRIDIE